MTTSGKEGATADGTPLTPTVSRPDTEQSPVESTTKGRVPDAE